jgi:hypothetical protein
LPFFPDPRATAPTRCNFKSSDHPTPPFTQGQKCTDGSIDARIFAPSVHPTLYKSVGPTRHNGSAPPLSQTLTRARPPHSRPSTAALLASGDPLAYARARAHSAVLRARRRPPRRSPASKSARAPLTPPRVSPPPPIPAVRRHLCSPAAV